MYISIEQAIEIYDELILAKEDKLPFRENVAEIYVFKLMPFTPTYNMNSEGKKWDEDNRMIEKKAAEDFHSLCHIFAKKHTVSININGHDMHEWISKIRIGEFRFFHKVEVEVKKLSEEKNV